MRPVIYFGFYRVGLVVMFGLYTSIASAQDSENLGFATIHEQPFYSVTAAVPTRQVEQAIGAATANPTSNYEIDFLVSPRGEIAGLEAYNIENGQRTRLCSPIPVQLVGPPPRTIYLIPIGCGGGGGGGTLSVDTLVVEFSSDGVNLEDADLQTLDISVREIRDGVAGMIMQVPVKLPDGVAE